MFFLHFKGPLAALLTLEELIDILSMGALTAYCVVSICVVILRYYYWHLAIFLNIEHEQDESIVANKFKSSFNLEDFKDISLFLLMNSKCSLCFCF